MLGVIRVIRVIGTRAGFANILVSVGIGIDISTKRKAGDRASKR